MPVYEDWQKIFGEQFGYKPSYQRRLYEEGKRDIGTQFADIQKRGISDLGERGFYSARPVQRMTTQFGTQEARALQDLQQGIRQSSEEFAQRQKGQLFGAVSQETIGKESAEQQQEYALARMDKQQQFTVLNMSTRQRYELAQIAERYRLEGVLAETRADLEKKGWGHLLGAVVGGFVGAFTGGFGGQLGYRVGGGGN